MIKPSGPDLTPYKDVCAYFCVFDYWGMSTLVGIIVICVFSHQQLEADLLYWMDQARSNNQGRQHHYDENSPTGPRDPSSYRYGADVNYDYY